MFTLFRVMSGAQSDGESEALDSGPDLWGMVSFRENPTKMYENWGYPYDSGNPHMFITPAFEDLKSQLPQLNIEQFPEE